MQPKSHLCERARSWASLRADSELSELESALLDAHLGRCASCRTFARGTEEIAAALRSARLQRPAPILVQRQRAGHTGLRALQVAAAIAVVVTAGVIAAVSGPAQRADVAKPVSMVAGVDSPDRLRELRRPALIEQGRSIPRNRQLPGEPV
jgi:predicted anti-sigma-YlaC factor YlaD